MTRTRIDRTHFLAALVLLLASMTVVSDVAAQTSGSSTNQTASISSLKTTATPTKTAKVATHKIAAKPKTWSQVGNASWYGYPFNGRNTTNGEVYDMYRLTCAHRNLPLGSWIKVTNLRNHKWVVLRVNDRGPFVDDRVIDLSYAAAQMLSIKGVSKVKLELLPSDTPNGQVQPTTLAQLTPPAHAAR
jgi:rare lipoprotein A